MKSTFLTTLGFAMVLGCSSIAQAGPLNTGTSSGGAAPSTAGPFLGVDAGAFWLQDLSAGNPFGVDFKFKTGWGVTVPIGYDFGNGLSIAFSAGYYDARFDGVVGHFNGSTQTAQINGGQSFVPLMANVAYKINLTGSLHWYLGAGAGGVYSDSSFSAYDNPAARSITYGQLGGRTAFFDGLSDKTWDFGFQAFTGLSLDLSPNTALNIGYRFLHVNDNYSVNGSTTSDFNGHSVEIGLMWKL